MKTVIIGQSQSGKSALLAGLHFASLQDSSRNGCWWQNFGEMFSDGTDSQRQRRTGMMQVECHNLNAEFQLLSKRFAEIIRRGFFPINPTEDVTLFELNVRARRPWLPWELVGQSRVAPWCGISTRVEMPDGPGGALFDDLPTHVEHRRMLVEHLKAADGVILCLPASPRGALHKPEEDDEKRKFFEFFYGLIAEVNSGHAPLCWRNLAVVLTKADQIFYPLGKNAQNEVTKHSTVDRLAEWLAEASFSEVLIQQLKVATNYRIRIGAGWSSIYGFTKSGTANYDPKEGKLLISPPQYRQAEVLANWRPYQLLDPFLFAAAGYTLPDRPNDFPGFVTIA